MNHLLGMLIILLGATVIVLAVNAVIDYLGD